MTSIELFNGLNGKTVSRNYLEEILQQAKAENQTAIVYRLSKVLNDNPKYKRFEMTIQSYPHAKGLAGIQHAGDYREALDDCGRLRKGWKFVKGNVVKVEKKEKKEVSKPKKQEAKTEKNECKTCDKKYKFLIYKTQTSNKYTLAFSYADLADKNKSVFDFRKTHKGQGYNEFFVINNAILLEKYKKGTDYLILSKSDFDKKEFYKHLEKQEIKNTENQEETFIKYVLPLYEERKANPDKKLSVKESKDSFFVESKEFWKVFKNIQTDYVKTQHLRGIIKILPKGFEMLKKNCKTCEIVDKLQTKLIFSKMNGRGKESSLKNRLNDLFGKEITLEALFLEFENYSATKYELGDVGKERKVFYNGLEFSFWWQNESLDIQISQSFADYIFTHIEDKDKALFETIKKIIDKERKKKTAKPVKKSQDKKQNSVEKSSNDLILADNQPTKLNILLSSTEKENQSAKDIQNIFDKKLSKMLRLRSGFINTNEFDFKAPKTSKKGIESFEKIVIKDELRPALTGVLIEKEVYVGTDTHKLLVIERTKNDGLKTGKIYDVNARYINYLNVFKNIDDALSEKEWNDERYIDAVFPNYETVFPKQYRWKTPFVDIEPILNHAYKAYYLLKFDVQKEDSYTIPFRIGKLDIYISALKLFESLQCLYVNGTKQVSFECVAYNKPITIKSKENKNVALLMPVIVEKKSDLNVNQVQISATENKDFKESQGLAAPCLSGLAAPTAQNSETIAFNKEILKAKREGFNTDKVLKLGKAKGELKKIVGDKEMRISQATIKKAMTKDDSHIITWENLINLPDYLNNPLAIFKSKTAGFVVLTEIINAKNKPVIAPLHIVKKGNYIEVKSLYSRKNDSTYQNWVKEDLLLYINKKSDLAFKTMGTIPNLDSKSQDKNTKKSVSNKKTAENFGLGLPQEPMSSESVGPQVFVEESPLTPEGETYQPEPVNPLPAVAHHRKGSLAEQLANASTQTESYQIDRVDMAQFLGDMEIKNTDSLVITLTGGQGSGKTRFAFQFMNDLAQRYKVGHISIEEHPKSRLYIEKVHQYLNPTALNNIEAHDVRSLSEIDKIIRENEVIVIDSFQKIKEIDSKFEVDKDLRKKYNGKLFLVIFQQTTDGKMRGGSKSQFDGDIILFTEKFPNYQENYVYPDKNRYNSIPADQLKYNIFQQRLLPVETEEQTIENQVYDVIY
ncbi:MuF-C-terminal domain-containing protein [Capnocytophaga canis]|uniref:Phage MuF C-terminal domain-containing protein n=1 Tax=Capnocytophaga canis TaxID=1848903 RepID=A0A0B7IQY1_9FLAO|nr:hypothetical protein [Capnocytophaga canis]CEN54306.1 hypothetical protein CCAND93_820005 [Capnocytophaga canis]